MQAALIPNHGGRPIRLQKDVTVVGRRRWVCDIYFDDRTVSKFHYLLIKSPDGMFFVRDLGSVNGTIVNGRKVTEEAVLHGDEIVFATQRFRLRIAEHLPDVFPSPESEEDELRTVVLPHDRGQVPARQVPEEISEPQSLDGGALQKIKMTAEDVENFREWLQQAAAGDSADSSDVKAVRADDDSASGDDGLMTSDSDVELVADDTTP